MMQSELWNPSVTLPQIFNTAARLSSPQAREAWNGPSQRIAVVGSLTMDFLAKAIACAVFREGVYPHVYTGLFGAYVQEVLDPASALHAFAPEAVVIAPDWRDIATPLAIDASETSVERAIETKVSLFERLWSALRPANCSIFQHVVVPPNSSPRGVADRRSASSATRQVERFNETLIARAGSGVHWVETDRLADRAGLAQWAPQRFYLNGRLPFDPRFLPAYMRAFGATWRSANARAKKVLALDLDNTLWGGVVGDDGVDNLRLGPGSPEGEAFAAWCAYVKDLGARGVVLAVCSKNDPEIAKAAFAHKHLPLTLDDFAAFECSWNDKASGLQTIAQRLNLSVDSIVFADDNPAECALVAQALPMAGVVSLGSDPSAFVDLLEHEHWFDLQQYTRDDVVRSTSYLGRAKAEALLVSAPDLPAYLTGLEMEGRLRIAREDDLVRIAQLEQKTNQFNLTTRRHSETALREFAHSGAAHLLVFGLRDRFTDHGLVSSLVLVEEGDTLRIDSWLMSCRVFARTAEQFIISELLDYARTLGAKQIAGEYVATEKNGVVANLYRSLGFERSSGNAELWRLDVGTAPGLTPEHFIRKVEEPVGVSTG